MRYVEVDDEGVSLFGTRLAASVVATGWYAPRSSLWSFPSEHARNVFSGWFGEPIPPEGNLRTQLASLLGDKLVELEPVTLFVKRPINLMAADLVDQDLVAGVTPDAVYIHQFAALAMVRWGTINREVLTTAVESGVEERIDIPGMMFGTHRVRAVILSHAASVRLCADCPKLQGMVAYMGTLDADDKLIV